MLSAPLEVLSMHLVSPVSPPPWRSVPLRIDQLSDLQAHLEARPGINRIVAGDMNASPVWPAYRRLTSMMRDGLAQAGPTRRTWGPYWWSPRVLRIDHVLVSGVTVVDSRVVVIRGSDHSAIVADIEV
jgi:endonuclease/exonuclease/phosphatase (EEP) superfamily protein YafD